MRGVLDTSVFIASESGRPLRTDLLPDESAVSVLTLAELQAGVLAETRARRLLTFDAVGDVELIGSGRRTNVDDLWIAATAASRDLAVVTQDDDFTAVEGIAGLRVVRV